MTGNHVSLFTGLGMLDHAASTAGWRTVATAEIDPFCRRVLERRFPGARHFNDVHDVRATAAAKHALGYTPQQRKASGRPPLLISGGFPCQDLSPAGLNAGLTGPHSGLWTEFHRIIEEFQPDNVLIENVAVLTSRGLSVVLWDLDRLGYNAAWECIPAGAIGAPHVRDRIWIVARKQPDAAPDFGSALDTWRGTVRGHPARMPRLARAGTVQDGQLFENVSLYKRGRGIYPTPTTRDGTEGPGRSPHRTGGPNLRTVINELDGDYKLNPVWVEWLMGMPANWSNPDSLALSPHQGWAPEFEPTLRVHAQAPYRRPRLVALGNSLVPQAAALALAAFDR